MVEVFKALGEETRLRIYNLLSIRQLCVCELEAILGISQSNASRHLNKMKNAGLIDYEKQAQWVYYKIDEEFIQSNQLLHEYLLQQMKENKHCIKDKKKLEEYVNDQISCENLENKEKEIPILK